MPAGSLVSPEERNGTFDVVVRTISQPGQELAAGVVKKSPDGTLFRWAVPRRRVLLKWSDFLREQKVDGSSKWPRRSGATYVEIHHKGEAQRFLGHSNAVVATRHYLDQTLTMDIPHSPPSLRQIDPEAAGSSSAE